MLYIGRRAPMRRRRSHAKKRVRPVRRLLLVAGVLVLIFSVVSEWGLSSVSEELTQEAANRYLAETVNDAVHKELENCENSFVSVTRDASGNVSAVTADTEALNRLKTGVLAELNQSLNQKASVFVPIGSLTDVGLFNGRGFQVPIRLKFEGDADISFSTDFVSAGINQSCHRITMTITARVYSESKRFRVSADSETATVLAETVIVGSVPELATGIWK